MIDVVLFILAIAFACYLMRVKVAVSIQQQAVQRVAYKPHYSPQSDPITDWLFSGPTTNLGHGPVAAHQNLSLKRPARTTTKLSGTTLTMPRLTEKRSLNDDVKRTHPDHGGKNVEAFMEALNRRRNNG